jgi:hypothetical protein
MGSDWILARLARGVWIGFDWLRTGTGTGCCECGDEPLGSCATQLVSHDTDTEGCTHSSVALIGSSVGGDIRPLLQALHCCTQNGYNLLSRTVRHIAL